MLANECLQARLNVARPCLAAEDGNTSTLRQFGVQGIEQPLLLGVYFAFVERRNGMYGNFNELLRVATQAFAVDASFGAVWGTRPGQQRLQIHAQCRGITF